MRILNAATLWSLRTSPAQDFTRFCARALEQQLDLTRLAAVACNSDPSCIDESIQLLRDHAFEDASAHLLKGATKLMASTAGQDCPGDTDTARHRMLTGLFLLFFF